MTAQEIDLHDTFRQLEYASFAVLYQLGVSYGLKKDWNHAEEFYAAALAVKPDSVATLRDLARLARASGELEKALSYLVRAHKLAADDTAVLYEFGLSAFRMGLI